ncbi:MAG: hypothetical protein U0414_38585 [Polyangiaceae bacterium]
MLTGDVRFEGFTATDWSRVLGLFAPQKASGEARDPDRPRGAIFAIVERAAEGAPERLRKLVHTRAGRVRLDDVAADWPLKPEELARRNHASLAIVIERGTLEAIMERFGAKVRRSDDLTAQSLLFVSLVQEHMIAGRIRYWPERLHGMPVPSPAVVNGTLDAICPGGTTLLLGLFDHGELWTSIALRRHASGGFDWILGPDDVRRDMGLLAGDFRRDYRHLARTVERRTGKLSLGCFAEASTFRRLEVDPSPGAWAKAVAVRDVILSPVPPALAIPLGLDAGRAALSAVKTVLDRVDAWKYVNPAFGLVRDLFPPEVSDPSRPGLGPSRVGFEPLELLRRLLSRDV